MNRIIVLAFVSLLLLQLAVALNQAKRIPITATSYENEVVNFVDDFNTFDLSMWDHELTLGGGGNWEFEYYTNNRTNSFVRDSVLYLQPTLSADQYGGDSNLMSVDVNIWGSYPIDGCTSNEFYGCERTGGAGGNMFNPIQSAAVRSLRAFTLKYGRIEISARLPLGDWLWPAIWLMPRWNQYGAWPASGEVDIMESRGNDPSYGSGGADQFGSTLHFGPSWQNDAWQKATKSIKLPNGTFHDEFHIFGFYWDNTTMYTYLDKDSNRLLNIDLTKTSFWGIGNFSSNYNNPWQGQQNIAPFDQEYYLVMNVACGGTNGYFPDGVGQKPWSDTSAHAVNDFYTAKNNWYSTWKGDNAALQIDWVKTYTNVKGQGSKNL